MSDHGGCRTAGCVSPADEFHGPALPPLPLFEINDLLEKDSVPGRSQTLREPTVPITLLRQPGCLSTLLASALGCLALRSANSVHKSRPQALSTDVCFWG